MTSPYEREVLTHYWTSPNPWKGGSENWTQLDHEIVNKLIVLRLLTHEEIESDHPNLIVNRDAVRVYMDALAAVPYPVLQWVMPLQATSP